MKMLAQQIEELIKKFKNDFYDLDEELTTIKISQDKWSIKEIIGHLIDSASNNHQRFVRMKISEEISFPDYNNEEWLKAQHHQNMKFNELMNLFYFFNKLLIGIIEEVDDNQLTHKWKVTWFENKDFITLEELMIHYVDHLKGHYHHMHERLNELINL